MIAFEKPGSKPLLHIRKFRSRAAVAFWVLPAGWLLMTLGNRGAITYAVGAALMILALALTLSVLGTGTNIVAAGVGDGLDEFELSARVRAQASAYRWFGLFVSSLCSGAIFAGLFGISFNTSDERFVALYFWIMAYAALLPGWFLTSILPGGAEEVD